MASWDRLGDKQIGGLQDELVREQVRAVTAGAPYWKQRLAAIGRSADAVKNVAALTSLPAVGERDVSPTGDAAEMAGLVVRGGEQHFALYADGPKLRRALWLRATNPQSYRRVVATEVRPTSFVWSGLGFRFPLASTRGDLDVIARAGARLFSLLGLTTADSLLSALPHFATAEHTALHYAALAAGVPAVFAGDDEEEVAAAALLLPPTTLAATVTQAAELVIALADQGVELSGLRTLLVVGAPDDEERAEIKAALQDAGATAAVVLAAHVPSGARVLWGECRESAGTTGLHTYPDLEVVQAIDPDTGEATPDLASDTELVITQLSMRGSALLRWRTADLVSGIESSPCPACGRSVPRVLGTRRHALVVASGGGRALDLRAIAGALSGLADVLDWRVVVGGRDRDGDQQVVVHLGTEVDPGEAAVAAAADIRAVAGMLPSQLVSTTVAELESVAGEPLTRRVLLR